MSTILTAIEEFEARVKIEIMSLTTKLQCLEKENEALKKLVGKYNVQRNITKNMMSNAETVENGKE